MNLLDNFYLALGNAKRLKNTPSKEDNLELYALYRQATIGNVRIGRPKYLGVAEWNAWHSKWNTNPDKVRQDYINKVQEVISKIGLV